MELNDKLFLESTKDYLKRRKMTEYDTDLNYEEDTKIDKENLHIEFAEHPSLVYNYGKHCVNLTKEYDKANEKVKTLRSELIRKANKNPEKCCGKSKPTAGDIEAYYRTHADYKEAKEGLIDAKYELGMAENAKNAIVYTKSKSLVKLNDQWEKEYYTIEGLPKSFGDPISKQGKGIKRKKKEKN